MELVAAVGLVAIGALLTLVALLGLALYKSRGHRIKLGGLRLVDTIHSEDTAEHIVRLTTERDDARREAERLRDRMEGN